MIVAASVTSLLSLFLAHSLSSKSLLNKIAKASMVVTLILSLALLSTALGYLKLAEVVNLVAIVASVVSLIFVGTMLNTHGVFILIVCKSLCWCCASLLVFYTLASYGLVTIA